MLKSQRGVGLVEIIIALVIFAIGISAAIRMLPVSNAATSRARNVTIATNLAQEKIEELMGSQFNDPDLSAGNHADPQNPIDRHFTRTWNVIDNNPITNMKLVTVTVSYNTGSSDSTVVLTTHMTSRR
jgi:prepilin-type N-terminal cleavage/methylation domain-containing protein